MQIHVRGYESGDPRIKPAAGHGIDRPAELPETMNSYERRIIEPNLANDILMERAEYCMSQAGRALGEFECPRHYNDAVERLYAPLLVKRLREAEAEIARLKGENEPRKGGTTQC